MPITQTANVLNTFDLDMIPDSAPVIVYCDQGDHGDGRLVIHLVDDGVPYEPLPGALAVIQGTKPDGHSFIYSADIDGSTVIANLTEQMTACYGRTRVQVVVTEGNDRTGTYVFFLQVQKSALPQDPDLSQTDLQLIQQLIDEAESISVNVPYIGANGNWWIYSVSAGGYIDSGVDASITVDIADITMLDPSATPYVTNTGTNTDPIFHLFIPRGQTGATGADGVSPEVTITTITGGHRVTITDADHPGGQSFDVMDGAPGGMQASTYDPQGTVAAAGGIPDYVAAHAGGDVSMDLLEDTVGWTGKNLLRIPADVVTKSTSGVTFTVTRNAAGGVTSIDVDSGGSATSSNAILHINTSLTLSEAAILTGCPENGGSNKYLLVAYDGSTYISDSGSGVSVPAGTYDLYIIAYNGNTFSHLKFYPMLRYASIADDTYEPYHASVENYMLPQSVQNVMGAKNLLPININDIKSISLPGTWNGNTYTYRNVDFTLNTDASGYLQSITVNGTNSGDSFSLQLNSPVLFKAGSYILTGCPSGGGYSSYWIQWRNSTASSNIGDDTGSGFSAALTSDAECFFRLYVGTSAAISNVTFYPMLRLAEYTDPTYEPYAMTNKQLTDSLDGWTGIAYVDANSQVTFTGLNDDYAYALYVANEIAGITGVTKTGSGTNVTAIYTLSGVSQGDSAKLRIIK